VFVCPDCTSCSTADISFECVSDVADEGPVQEDNGGIKPSLPSDDDDADDVDNLIFTLIPDSSTRRRDKLIDSKEHAYTVKKVRMFIKPSICNNCWSPAVALEAVIKSSTAQETHIQSYKRMFIKRKILILVHIC